VVLGEENNAHGASRDVYLVFPFMDHDLSALLSNTEVKLAPGQIKYYFKSLLEALRFLHSRNILHRDIKASNILLDNRGSVVLADFGLARFRNVDPNLYTNRMITLWYRPPELLYGVDSYGPEVDVWSAGCVLAEMLLKKSLFPGKNELDQIEKIFVICGTPNESNWPGFGSLPWASALTPRFSLNSRIREIFAP
jgi:cyclin-dependent kinase 12/13